MQDSEALGPGLRVFERGWLSSNNILLDDGDAATLIDSGHCVHAGQTVALLRQVLAGRQLRQVINTHLHSDHCGGNAAVQREFACPVRVPSGSWRAVSEWDDHALSYAPLRQRIERYSAQGVVRSGETLAIGTRHWQVLAAPGHDPEAVMLFDADHGVLISADALWENGFGVVFPELEGEAAFDEVQSVLDLIATLPLRWVIPGHGAPFNDVTGALQRARARLSGYRADPARHLRHGAKVMLKYHLMEEQQQPLEALRAWLADMPLLAAIWRGLGRPEASLAAWNERLLRDMISAGTLVQRGGVVCER